MCLDDLLLLSVIPGLMGGIEARQVKMMISKNVDNKPSEELNCIKPVVDARSRAEVLQ